MYEAYYRLREKPFSILPDPDLIYWGQTHRMAFAMLEFGVLNNAGFSVITGEVGAGKTTLVRHLLRKIDPKTINIGLISNTPQGREELLQSIMVSLNLPFEASSPALLKTFQEFLYSQHEFGRQCRSCRLYFGLRQQLDARQPSLVGQALSEPRQRVWGHCLGYGQPIGRARSLLVPTTHDVRGRQHN